MTEGDGDLDLDVGVGVEVDGVDVEVAVVNFPTIGLLSARGMEEEQGEGILEEIIFGTDIGCETEVMRCGVNKVATFSSGFLLSPPPILVL